MRKRKKGCMKLMSTVICDAYKFDKNYSLLELNDLMLKLREDIKEIAQQEYYKLIMKDFIYYLDYRAIHGIEKCKEMVNKINTKSDKNKHLKEIWTELSKDNINYLALLLYIEWYNQNKINLFPLNPNILDSDYDFRSELVIIPIEDKILALYYGNYELKKIVESQSCLMDYHYQNQCDRPECISEEEWDQRRSDWDKAIGWKAPSQCGMTVSLLNQNDLNAMLSHGNWIIQEGITNITNRAKAIVDTFTDYPNPLDENASYSEWIDYMETDAYKKWRLDKIKEICPLLKNYTVEDIKEMFINKQ